MAKSQKQSSIIIAGIGTAGGGGGRATSAVGQAISAATGKARATKQRNDGRKVGAAKAAINNRYSLGVPPETSTTEVQQELNAPYEKRGRKNFYSWRTVNRALGRE